MDLDGYFERIGYAGGREANFATLDAVMRAHVAAVPFENLDVQLGRRVSVAIEPIYAKLVGERRGGWCYEQNGLLGWALAALGFDVRRLGCGVMRAANGDAALGNHLALLVTLDEPWLVDAGFGGTQAAPLPLAEGEHRHEPFGLGLAREDGGFWRFSEWNDPQRRFSFDFRTDAADEALLARTCDTLQSDPESIFVQNLVVQRRLGESHRSLRGRVFSERDAQGETRRLVASGAELVELLDTAFGLNVPEAAGLWDTVCARHAVLFPDDATALSG